MLILGLMSLSSVKVTGQSSRSPQENVAKVISAVRMTYVVSATANDFVFLFLTIVLFCYTLYVYAVLAEMCRIGDFKEVGHSRLNFRLEGYVSRRSLWIVRLGNDCTATLLLKVFCQRNFIADFIQLKLSFIQKKK